MVNLELIACFKCKFYGTYYYYICNAIPDSSSIEEKYLYGKTGAFVKRINFNGTLNGFTYLTQSELTPLCQRFEHLEQINVISVKSVDENLFQGCKNLKEFIIINSDIKEIPENLFFEHPQLTAIGICNNELSALPENIFINQRELRDLYIYQNQISCLPPNIFKSLTKLKYLSLSKNKIQSLNPKWFESLQSLKKLVLPDNKIQDLPKNVFVHMRELNDLHLDGNQLTTIHSDSFGIHRKLSWINLDNNKINAIDGKIIENIVVSGNLFLRENACSNEDITIEDEANQKLSKCFKNYQPRKNQSKH